MEYCKELEKDIPSFWGVELLENISDMKYGKMLSADKFSKIGYPVFSGYGLRGFYKEYMYENPEILIICRGVSGTGKVVLSPPKSYITNLSIVTPITNNSFQKGFVYYYLKNNNLRALDSGSAQSMITIGDLNKVPILFPDEGTQVLFNIIFEKLTNARRNVEAENNHLEELKVLLLARMFDLG
jgi:type I restriction enzyme S subunit